MVIKLTNKQYYRDTIMTKLKIILVGLSGSGKTNIANFLSESVDTEPNESLPTQGARILEFECSASNPNNNKSNNIDVELWDCSGDRKFESCWPAFRQGVQGVVLVYSPTNSQYAVRELELLYNYFVTQPSLSPKQCVVFCNVAEAQSETKGLKLSSTFSMVSQVTVSIYEGGNKLKNDFANFILSIAQNLENKK